MTGDDVLRTWADVARRLPPMGRGAPYRLAQALGMNPSYFYRKLKSAAPLTAAQAEAARAFLTGAANEEAPAVAAAQASRRRLPVFGYAASGGDDLIALDKVLDWMELPLGLELGPGEWFAVLPPGSSMEPRIFAGEPQVVRRNHPPSRGKDVVVEFSDGSGVIKTYRGQRDGQVFVEQYNPPEVLGYDATKVSGLHGVGFKL